jgi:hypothetical protein
MKDNMKKILLLITLSVLAAACGSATGAPDNRKAIEELGIGAYFEAYAKFEQMRAAASSATPPGMPRITDPAVAAVIATLSDSKRFLVQPDFQQEHQWTLLEVCDKANQASKSYAMFDLKSHLSAGIDPVTTAKAVRGLVQRNVHTFQNELKLLGPFAVHCMARGIPLLSEFTSRLKPEQRTDIRKAGLRQYRAGVLKVIDDTLVSVADGSLTESFRTAILKAVAENSVQLASVFPIAERQKIIARLADSRSTMPSFAKKYLATISAAMSDQHCTGLCAY